MRYHELIESITGTKPMKAWYNPQTNQAFVFSPNLTHGIFAQDHAEDFSISSTDSIYSAINNTIRNGWSRARNFNEAKMYNLDSGSNMTDGVVQSMTSMQARKTLIWMRDNDYLPISLTVEIGIGKSELIQLFNNDIDQYIKRGKIPKHEFV